MTSSVYIVFTISSDCRRMDYSMFQRKRHRRLRQPCFQIQTWPWTWWRRIYPW